MHECTRRVCIVYVCMHVCMHVCVYVCVCMYVRICMHLRVCVCVMYVCSVKPVLSDHVWAHKKESV